MRQTAIFWPMLAHVLLVYIVYLVMLKRRYLAVKSGEARVSQYKVRSTEPASSVTVANNLINQFELPVLFHVLCLALFVTNGVNYLTLALMWLFIVSRYVHAWCISTETMCCTAAAPFSSAPAYFSSPGSGSRCTCWGRCEGGSAFSRKQGEKAEATGRTPRSCACRT